MPAFSWESESTFSTSFKPTCCVCMPVCLLVGAFPVARSFILPYFSICVCGCMCRVALRRPWLCSQQPSCRPRRTQKPTTIWACYNVTWGPSLRSVCGILVSPPHIYTPQALPFWCFFPPTLIWLLSMCVCLCLCVVSRYPLLTYAHRRLCLFDVSSSSPFHGC